MSRAKFTTKTKQAIVERDVYCRLCWKQGSEVHHLYFGTQTNYWDNRNDIDQWILVCRDCHTDIHSCSKWEGKRQEAILYVENL